MNVNHGEKVWCVGEASTLQAARAALARSEHALKVLVALGWDAQPCHEETMARMRRDVERATRVVGRLEAK